MHARAHRAAASKSLDRSWNSYVCGHGVSFLSSFSLMGARIPSFYISFFPFSPSSKRIERERDILAESWEPSTSDERSTRITTYPSSPRRASPLGKESSFPLPFNRIVFEKKTKNKKEKRVIATAKSAAVRLSRARTVGRERS